MDTANLQIQHLSDDGTFPNNERLPVLIYKAAFEPTSDLASRIETTLRKHGWGGSWRNGIYDYHHYHSTAHEVLGVAVGTARVQLGGPQGIIIEATAGDVLILPAGTAHKNLGSSADFLVIGAYPKGQEYDMNYGREGERPQADRNIAATPVPDTDPIFGEEGPLTREWRTKAP